MQRGSEIAGARKHFGLSYDRTVKTGHCQGGGRNHRYPAAGYLPFIVIFLCQIDPERGLWALGNNGILEFKGTGIYFTVLQH